MALLLDRLDGTEEAFIACKETHVKIYHPKAFKTYLDTILMTLCHPFVSHRNHFTPNNFRAAYDKVLQTCELSALNRASLNYLTKSLQSKI